ncbi:MAG: bifunctional ornithine acetyltransferase/N-acetylglutamate synthase [Clostridia bacterium]|nr:bifunctional ornithine acetyltransferase/N-acetylglutamate synthase [Clostridia bacterium]
MLLQISGGCTAARGFRAGGYGAYALLACGLPAVCSGVYGKNRITSAPEKWSSFITEQYETAQAVFLCGSTAGTAVGDAGYALAVQMAELAASSLGLPPEKVLLAAAGKAGTHFSMEEAEDAAASLARVLSGEADGSAAAALALSPFDDGTEIAVEFDLGDKKARLGGICRRGKPLALITTDAAISKEMLDRALRADAEETFFMAMPDGARPGDCVLCLASGMAGNKKITEEDAAYSAFCAALRHVTSYLAKSAASLGRLLEITVQNAVDKSSAGTLARAAAASVPLRTAAGVDTADWASLLYAFGETDVPFDPNLLDISLRSTAGSVQLLRSGLALFPDDVEAVFDAPTVTFLADMKNGNASATAWSDFIE